MTTTSTRKATFLVVLVCEFLNLLGSGMAAISVTLMVYARTGGASTLAVLLAVRTLTSIFFSPFAGVVVDRFRQKHVLLGSNTVLAATVLVLFLMARSGHVDFTLIGAVFVVQALADSVAQSVIVSVVRHLAADVELVRSNSLVYLVQSVPAVLAPALGSWLFAMTGPGAVLGSSLAGLALSISLMSLFARGLPVVAQGPWRSPFAHVATGFRFIWANRGLRSLQLSYGALNFFNGLSAAGLVAYVTGHAGSVGWGTYSACGGAGLLLGALVMTVNKRPYRTERLLPGAQGSAAVLGRLLLAVPGLHWLWFLGNLGRNAGLQITGGPMTAIWQRQSPDETLGVVSGCRRLLSQGPYPFAVLIGGFCYDWWNRSLGHPDLFFVCLGLAELTAVSLWLRAPIRTVFEAENAPSDPAPRPGPPQGAKATATGWASASR
ncbi:hypothetical protein DN069_36885 [Streptacidiphilus pinicola]|uniref:MFS transporter n=1 Tax=Streptacidiphilus pinicola TaxID=2219663 RepID=A0A2X0I6U8_9ACTN|nr:MFS transporter [Streptacidiphilus pinicola]RAG80674.1 hypothetical protein DN069_36885 [Streptacidiphilus pinicola]